MCNNYSFTRPIDAVAQVFRGFGREVAFPEGLPNLAPNEDIRIRDMAPIVTLDGETANITLRRWGWQGPSGRMVFNYRSEGRFFPAEQRCLIPADAFYEFTDPSSGGKGRKDRWRFSVQGEDWFWIAGVVRGDAFAMLTDDPGPDVRPYHDRQVVVLQQRYPGAWFHADPMPTQKGAPRQEARFDVTPAPRKGVGD